MSRRIWGMAAAGVLLVAGTGVIWKLRSAPTTSYREVTAARGDLSLSVLATGTVQPENRLEIKAPIAGRMEEVLVKEGQRVRRGTLLAWMSSTERAALLDAARAKGPEEVKRWEELYRPTPVLAPIDGTLILRNVEPGQTFTATDAILVMSDRLTVKAQVDETDIAQIALKQPAEIVLDAYPEQKVPGRVDQIAFDAKTVNNVTTYVVDVLPEKTPAFMRSGMTANVTFTLQSKTDVLLVPTEAIREQEGRKTVLVKAAGARDKRTPEERSVETGLSDGKRTEIVSGLAGGETLLVTQPKPRPAAGGSPFSPLGSGGSGRRQTRGH